MASIQLHSDVRVGLIVIPFILSLNLEKWLPQLQPSHLYSR